MDTNPFYENPLAYDFEYEDDLTRRFDDLCRLHYGKQWQLIDPFELVEIE